MLGEFRRGNCSGREVEMRLCTKWICEHRKGMCEGVHVVANWSAAVVGCVEAFGRWKAAGFIGEGQGGQQESPMEAYGLAPTVCSY